MQQVGQALRLAENPTTDLPARSMKCRPVSHPTTLAECAALQEWAETTQPVHQSISAADFAQKLKFMAATLPSKNVDVEAGRQRVTVYASILGGQSYEAIEYLVRTACATLDWFPTPKQCLEIIAGYRAPATEQETALLVCRCFAEEAFDTWIENVRDGQEIGDAPDRWKRIAVERGVLRLLLDGDYAVRPQALKRVAA